MTGMVPVARYWREGIMAALFAVVLALLAVNAHKDRQLDACKQARAADQASWRAAADKARADDLANARAVESRNAAITQETERDLQSKLAAARAAAADYARLRAASQANRGRSGAAHLPQTSDPASASTGAGTSAVMDGDDGDEVACAEAVVKAEGWRVWWNGVSSPAPATSSPPAQP